jgi:hypothetical protein
MTMSISTSGSLQLLIPQLPLLELLSLPCMCVDLGNPSPNPNVYIVGRRHKIGYQPSFVFSGYVLPTDEDRFHGLYRFFAYEFLDLLADFLPGLAHCSS